MTRPIEIPRISTTREHGFAQLRGPVSRGELVKVRRGAYRESVDVGERWVAEELAELAHCAAVADRLTCPFMISHRSAARLFQWPVPRYDGVVDVTQGVRQSRCRDNDVRRHHTQAFRDAAFEAETVDGLPVTPRWLTAIDCARSLSPRDGLALVDAALADMAAMDRFDRAASQARQLVVRTELLARLRELGPGRGVVRARAVIEHADGFADRPGESRMRWLALAIGLPAPICQWEVRLDGHRYFGDAAWLADAPDWRRPALCFEYDGEAKYGGRGDVAAAVVLEEKQREDAFRDAGVGVHRVTKARLANHRRAASWMLATFPPSTRAALTPRPALTMPGL